MKTTMGYHLVTVRMAIVKKKKKKKRKKEKKKRQVLARMWKEGDPYYLLVGM